MERNYAIDYLKFFAIYSVVCLHSMTFNPGEISSPTIHFLVNEFPRYVIPFFFVAAGYFFGFKVKDNKEAKGYFKKYTVKLIRLFVFWGLFYLVYDCAIKVAVAVYMGSDIRTVIIDYFRSTLHFYVVYYGEGHLWFLTALIWSIVILFVFIRLKRLKLLLVFSLCLNLIGLFGQTYSGIYHLGILTRDALFFGLFYTTLGCYFAFHYDWIIEKINRIRTRYFIILCVLFSVAQMAERFVTGRLGNETVAGVDYYMSTIPLTVSLFCILIKNKDFGKGSMIAVVGKNTVRVYVLHMVFIIMGFWALHYFGIAELRRYLAFHLLYSLAVVMACYYFFVILEVLRKKSNSLLHVEYSVKKQKLYKSS